MVYLGDILIFSRSAEDHARHLELVLQQLQEHGLHTKLSKCYFGLEEIECLGHKVSAHGIEPHLGKDSAVKKRPTLIYAYVQVFLGLTKYYA